MLLSCLSLVGISIYQAVWNAPELARNNELVTRAFKVISTARTLERTIRDAELGQRNFTITGDAAYREPYRAAVQKTQDLLAILKGLTLDDAGQRPRMLEIERLMGVRIAELQRVIEIRQSAGADAAFRLMRENLGVDTARAINELTDATVGVEYGLLEQHQARTASNERIVSNTAVAGGIVALTIMALGAFLLLYSFRNAWRSERSRQEIEEQFGLLVDGVTDYAIFGLDRGGHVVSWNSGAERIKGYSAREIVGQDFACFYREEDRKAGVPKRVLEIAERDGKCETEGWRVRKDGSRFWASVVINRLCDPSGRLLGYAKVTRDITERRRQQEDLEQTRAALAQSQKMQALGHLTGGVAHDFNNLLTVISGAIEMIQRRLQDRDPDMNRYIGAARRGVDRATSLTQRLLAFSRRQPLDPGPLDPNKLVADVVEMLRRGLGEGIATETVLAGGLWWISADANQLEIAILNLVVNARDATSRGGKLTIETANVFLDETYAATHSEVAAGQYVMIAVSDTGRGMTKEVIAKAFEPFFTTKEVGQGTGLGLSQVYGFIKQSNGHVSIYSEPGEGTTVKVYLPRLDGPRPEGVVAHGWPVSVGPGGRTILVVEDDEEVRTFAVETLAELGHRILAAGDARAALRILEQETVDLLFTDVGLPGGIDGRQLADEALRRWPALKVLFTTGYTQNAIVHHGRLDAGIELIVKPFTQTHLVGKVWRLLDRRSGTPHHTLPTGG